MLLCENFCLLLYFQIFFILFLRKSHKFLSCHWRVIINGLQRWLFFSYTRFFKFTLIIFLFCYNLSQICHFFIKIFFIIKLIFELFDKKIILFCHQIIRLTKSKQFKLKLFPHLFLLFFMNKLMIRWFELRYLIHILS